MLIRFHIILLLAILFMACDKNSDVRCSPEIDTCNGGDELTQLCDSGEQNSCALDTQEQNNRNGGEQMGGIDSSGWSDMGDTSPDQGGTIVDQDSTITCNYPRVGNVFVAERYATIITSTEGWDNTDAARGTPDEIGAYSPNLDEGELLTASGWDFCHETGTAEITKVELAVHGRTQYDSGPYDILVELSAGGNRSVEWHQTTWGWISLDITSEQSRWSWDDIERLSGEVRLHTHPNNHRDSDVWIDAFRLTVTIDDCDVDCESNPVELDPVELDFRCESIGSNDHGDGFFTLAEFNDKLYAGLFGYELEHASMLYSYPDWELTSPGLTGISESICAMQEFDGFLYANTESSGDIFRSLDGSNWTRVFDGPNGSIGCGMTVFNNQIYAINYRNSRDDHGLIMRSTDGISWETVYDSEALSMYLREIIVYNNKIYAFALLKENNSGHMLSSEDGSHWEVMEVPNRYFRGHVWNGYLWLGSVRGAGSSGEVAVWQYDGDTFTQVLTDDTQYFTNLKDLKGHLFASTSNGWKEDPGPSSLWVSPNGMTEWRRICEFDRTAVWSMAVVNDTLYLGTWQYGASGQVYKVVETEDSSLPDMSNDDCEPHTGSLSVGQTYVIGVDAHSGDEASTEPKVDANDNRNGDNPEFRRHNVARAHNDYWYTSSHQFEGEPDPNGEQWVDFTPNFNELGVGCYQIVTQYRATENRATYSAHYNVMGNEGIIVQFEQVQQRGMGEYIEVDMGNQMMCPDRFIRVSDPGTASISFHPTHFTYLGPRCP